jgi:hypothetical protein
MAIGRILALGKNQNCVDLSSKWRYLMFKIVWFLCLLPIFFNSKIAAQNDSLDIIKATEYFREARALSDIDNGNLWGIKLYGPILFVNPQTRFIIANEQDSTNNLKKTGEVFCGQFPANLNVANTAINWRGMYWTMLVWPLPENKFQRKILLMHELFHRIQGQLNLPMKNPSSNHLDKKDGRILFRMEWKELLLALQSKDKVSITHIRNAVLMNKYRKEFYPGTDTLESQLEMNEGLAEYTGYKLSGEPEDSIISFWAQRGKLGERMYCFLLDNSGRKWRDKIGEVKSLVNLLAASYSISFKDSVRDEALKYFSTNADPEIMIFEETREKKMEAQTARLKEKFFNKPVLVFKLEDMNVQFDPRNLIPIDTLGTVYPNIRITDNWGILTVTNEAFMASDWKSLIIALPDNFSDKPVSETIKSNDWTLEIKKGWILKPIKRKGSFTLEKEKSKD